MIAIEGEAGRARVWERWLEAVRADADRWPLWLPSLAAASPPISGWPTSRPAGSGPRLLLLAAAWAMPAAAGPQCDPGSRHCRAGLRRHPGLGPARGRPRIERRLAATGIEGRVIQASPRENGIRLLIEPTRIDGRPGPLPRRLRITVAGRLGDPGATAGRRVAMRAVLLPLPAPAAPGAFDFPRQAYFQGLGGLGYATGPPRLLEGGGEGGAGEWLARLRQTMTQRIQGAIGGAAGAVAAALVTGERGAIPEAVNQAWRDTGLAHLLSISGLHISLVAGILFLGLRSVLALLPALALYRPIKKWAAGGAILAALFYLLLSGAEVPTQRSFLMAAIVFLAVMVDREAISLRLVAWAAVAILPLVPGYDRRQPRCRPAAGAGRAYRRRATHPCPARGRRHARPHPAYVGLVSRRSSRLPPRPFALTISGASPPSRCRPT
jgi:competence protein ComEC